MARRPYIREVPRFSWWAKKHVYTTYMLREATCIAIAVYCGLLIVGLIRLSQGEAAYGAYLAAMQSPVGIAVQIVIGLFALYHTITWFTLAPKGIPPMRFGGERVKPQAIVAAHYVGWAGVSAVVLLFVGLV